MPDPADRFQAELAVLRDGVVRAVRNDNIGDLKDGLGLYSSLIATVLDQFRRYEQALAAQPPRDLLNLYGREMTWLEDDIRTFLQAASSEPASDAAREVQAFLLDIVIEAFNRKELPAFGSFLQNYRFAWFSAKQDRPTGDWPRTRSSILLTLPTLATIG